MSTISSSDAPASNSSTIAATAAARGLTGATNYHSIVSTFDSALLATESAFEDVLFQNFLCEMSGYLSLI
jgi:2-methylcitrate dehydratase PrpD